MLTMDVELIHDLRMPLQLICAGAQLLRLSLDDNTVDARACVDMLVESAEYMCRMLERALEDCGRAPREAPRLVNRDIAACVRELCLRCRPYARQHGVALRCSGNVAALNMALDEDMLSRILLNLIFNALRHTPAGGTVRVRWRALGDRVEISVTDTGEGIPPQALPYIFLNGESKGGHGYGLPIARELARALGGELIPGSGCGRGGAFTLRLPVRAACVV